MPSIKNCEILFVLVLTLEGNLFIKVNNGQLEDKFQRMLLSDLDNSQVNGKVSEFTTY